MVAKYGGRGRGAHRRRKGRVGWAWQARLIRQYAKPARSVRNGSETPRCGANDGQGYGLAAPTGAGPIWRFRFSACPPFASGPSSVGIRYCRRGRFRRFPSDRTPRASDSIGDDPTSRDAGPNMAGTDERSPIWPTGRGIGISRTETLPKPDRNVRRVVDGCAGARSRLRGWKRREESAATQHPPQKVVTRGAWLRRGIRRSGGRCHDRAERVLRRVRGAFARAHISTRCLAKSQ